MQDQLFERFKFESAERYARITQLAGEQQLANCQQLEDLRKQLAMQHACPVFDLTHNNAPQHVRDTYDLIFEDVFKGQTQLDDSKWDTAFIWGPDLTINNEEQYYVDVLGGQGVQGPNPFVFTPEGVEIQATPITGTKPVTTNGRDGGQNYWSGILTTRDSCCYKYGYMEVCAKPPCNPSGMWAAIWLLNCMYYIDAFQKNNAENGGNGHDRFNPELDFEFIDNFGAPDCTNMARHDFTGNRVNPGELQLWTLDHFDFREINADTGQTITSGNVYQNCMNTLQTNLPRHCIPGMCNDVHTFGIDWCPEYVHFYIDGELVRCVNGAPSLVPDQLMYGLINFAVGGNFPFGFPATTIADPNDYPASFLIESARIWGHPDTEHTVIK